MKNEIHDDFDVAPTNANHLHINANKILIEL